MQWTKTRKRVNKGMMNLSLKISLDTSANQHAGKRHHTKLATKISLEYYQTNQIEDEQKC